MPWVKLDDTFPEHPKILAVGGNAGWLHVCALAYCNRNLTDGHIPASVLARLSDRKQPRTLVDRLVEAGLWEPARDGWQIHDFLEYQTSKARVEEERTKARDRMARTRGTPHNGSPNVRPNNSRSSPRSSPYPTTPDHTRKKDDDNDAESTTLNGHPSSSSIHETNRRTARNAFAVAAARTLANNRHDLTNRNGWIQRTTEGLLAERLNDIDHCIDHGYSTAAAVELLTSEPATPASTPTLQPWYADPHCTECAGEGFVKDDNGFMIECSCRQTESYPAKNNRLRSVK